MVQAAQVFLEDQVVQMGLPFQTLLVFQNHLVFQGVQVAQAHQEVLVLQLDLVGQLLQEHP